MVKPADGETEAEGLTEAEGETEALGERLALGESEADGESEAEGETEGEGSTGISAKPMTPQSPEVMVSVPPLIVPAEAIAAVFRAIVPSVPVLDS